MITKETGHRLQAFTIGNAVVDTNIVSTTFNKHSLSLNPKHPVTNQSISIGGGALNAAATLSKLKFQVSPICPIGSDHQGAFIKSEIDKKEINTTTLVTKKTHSHQSTIISIPNQEDPLLFSYKNPKLFLSPQDIPQSLLKNSNLLYIASFEPENIPAVDVALSSINKDSVVAFNPHTNLIEHKITQFEYFLEKSHIIFMNQYEAELYMKKKGESWNLHTFFSIVCRGKNKTIVLTLGRNGVHILHQDKLYSHPSLAGDIVNTVGAGDAFNACFSGLLVQGEDVKTAILYGLLNSSSIIKYHNTQSGALSLQELESHSITFDQLSIRPARNAFTF